MKTALLTFFLTTLCAVLPGEAAYAATGGDATARRTAQTRTSSQPADHDRARKKDNPRGSAIVAKPNRPQALPKTQKPSTARKPTGAQRSATRANGMPLTNKAATAAHHVQPSTVSGDSALSPNFVGHRNPNPATVGGSARSRAAHIRGCLNGTRMGRKP